MAIVGQMRQIAQEAVDAGKEELLKALQAAEARIEALEAKLGGSGDEQEAAAKAPRRGRGAAKADPEPGQDVGVQAAPAVVDAKSSGA
jgi:hypothetical protein